MRIPFIVLRAGVSKSGIRMIKYAIFCCMIEIPEFDTFAGQDIGKIEATDRWNGDL